MSDSWLVVIDHQNVFADPSSQWAAPEFDATVDVVADLAREHGDRVVLTRWVPATGADRTGSWQDYLRAWPFADVDPTDPMYELVPTARHLSPHVVTRPTFGKWGAELEAITGPAPDLTLVGVATDCCVLSTALAAADAGARVRVVAAGCAGSTTENHDRALAAMSLYGPQITIV